ncbi:CLUMA_CG000107, isoform A [Clunio marinus]|uniref:CLUMA_CG000107, isoform A n=1 Tax=Clunio marinus TaxID=568069 RepID=A0A1J1HEZ3_9DIPT|nr:CLUMA_CG000107, isoform A [Clunio marinus]
MERGREMKSKRKNLEQGFKRKDRLDRHIYTHTGKKQFACDYSGCSKEYTNSFHLRRHIKTSHQKIKLVSCKSSDCNETFTNSSNMNRHFQSHHINLLPYICTQCIEKFRRKQQLRRHEAEKHTGKYPYNCSYCQKGFINTSSLTRHLKTHKQKEKTHSCSECQTIFSKWSQLVLHRRRFHKEKHFVCDLCDKYFSRKPHIKEHMKLHSLTSQDVFQCYYENCPKFYTLKRNLTFHIRSKHEGKRWICDYCLQKLSTKQKLILHLEYKIRTGKCVINKRKLFEKKSIVALLTGLDIPSTIDENPSKENFLKSTYETGGE